MNSNEGDSFKFEDAELTKLLENLSNQPPIELDIPDVELNKLLENLSDQPPIELDIPDAELNKLLESLSDQIPIELDFSDTELTKLLEEANQPFPNISFDDEAARKILEYISSADSELNFDLSQIDLSTSIQNAEVSGIESELIPEPDPNIMAKDVAAWMLTQVESEERFYQRDAVWKIKKYFGERFIYLNQNHNPAISREVLKEFLRISLKTVVWNKRERYWRFRQSSDHINNRMVDD
jgi:hypothetical protein